MRGKIRAKSGWEGEKGQTKLDLIGSLEALSARNYKEIFRITGIMNKFSLS
jgi:hypothetical protein